MDDKRSLRSMRERIHVSVTTGLQDDPDYQSIKKSCEQNSVRSNCSVRTVTSVENNSYRSNSLQRNHKTNLIFKPYDDEEKETASMKNYSIPSLCSNFTSMEMLQNHLAKSDKVKALHKHKRLSSVGDFL